LADSAGGIALDQVNFAQRGVFFLAVGQFSWQAQTVHDTLAAGDFARLARGFAGTGGVDDLGAQQLGIVGVFQQEFGEFLADDFLHDRLYFAGDQLVLGLAGKLGLGHLDR